MENTQIVNDIVNRLERLPSFLDGEATFSWSDAIMKMETSAWMEMRKVATKRKIN